MPAASSSAARISEPMEILLVVGGLEIGRRFRAAHPTIPVLMVSDLVPWFRDRVEDVDPCAFLEKPFDFDELLHKVRTLLNATVALPRRGTHK
jgi:DNA-binding response OmpR family regulator